VMDGLEAATKIIELDIGVPIVAMTANIMSNDRETYKTSGMRECIGKPFSSQELWRCLLKYLPQATGGAVQKNEQFDSDIELQNTLQSLFAKNNQKKYEEIFDALETGEIKLAHRLAHTLKGNAGQLGKALLQQAAAQVEQQLKDGKNLVTGQQLAALKRELDAALAEFEVKAAAQLNGSSRLAEGAVEPLDADLTRELFANLEPMLKMGNPECRNFIDGLCLIPGSGELIRQIKDFDFEAGVSTLAELAKNFSTDIQ